MMKTKTVSILARGVSTPRGIMGGLLRTALLASTALTINAYSVPALAQDATWLENPVDGNYDNGANWSTGWMPDAVGVVFGSSSITNLYYSGGGGTRIWNWTLGVGASNYDINVGGFLSFEGDGINIQGGSIEGGRLEISSDENLGSGGSVVLLDQTTLAFTNNGTYTHAITADGTMTLEVDRENTNWERLTVTGSVVISDGASAGQIVKTGKGTLILTGDNTHTGGTTISVGTLVLAGNNTHTASTTISGSGILQIGNGGATGSLSGDIVNENILEFNRTGTLTISGNISGSGRVRQIGTGTTILTGNNSYAAVTAIRAGTLQFGDGNTSSNNLAGRVTVSEGGTLVVHASADVNVEQDVTLNSGSTLTIIADTSDPALTADTVNINPDVVLNIGGISNESRLEPEMVLIKTNSGITGDFATMTIGNFTGSVDYAMVTTWRHNGERRDADRHRGFDRW